MCIFVRINWVQSFICFYSMRVPYICYASKDSCHSIYSPI